MANPWDPDRVLSTEGASRAIASSFSGIEARNLQFLGSGWEFDAWLTADGWVFRFPRRAESDKLVEPEQRVHELVRPALPPGVAIPHVELVGQPGPEFPYRFFGHRFIPGIPADDIDVTFLPSLARQIAEVLGAIHGISENDARKSGVCEMAVDEEGRREWVEQRLVALDALGAIDPVGDTALRWFKDVALPLPWYEGPLCLIHHDLSPEHVLVNPATGRLTGVLDWTDAILGDAARDFVFLVAWRGWPFTEEVLRHYPLAVDRGFRERLRYMSKVLTVLWLGLAHERGTEFEKLKGWVHNAFASD